MKKNIFIKYSFLAGALALMFSSCRKDSFVGNETKESGKSFVRVEQAQQNNQFFSPFSDVKKIQLFTVRKDAASQAEQQTQSVVTLTALDIATINTFTGGSYTALPSSIYTDAFDSGVARTSNGLTLTFAPGDFAKNISLNVDGSKMDLSKQYAVGYVISNSGDLTKKKGMDTIIATVAIKNKWDGVYEVTKQSMVDKANSGLGAFNDFLSSAANTTGVAAPMQYELRTISATKCVVYDNYFFGGYDMPIKSGSSYSYYGSFDLIVEFDPNTDKIVSVTNYYGQPAANGRSAALDPSGANQYSNGVISIKYFMLQPGAANVGADGIRTSWDETWTYKGSR